MATVTRRNHPSGTRYQVKVRLQGRPPQSATFDRLKDAKAWAASTESAIRERRYFRVWEASRHTVADLIQEYRERILPTKAVGTHSAQTSTSTGGRRS